MRLHQWLPKGGGADLLLSSAGRQYFVLFSVLLPCWGSWWGFYGPLDYSLCVCVYQLIVVLLLPLLHITSSPMIQSLTSSRLTANYVTSWYYNSEEVWSSNFSLSSDYCTVISPSCANYSPGDAGPRCSMLIMNRVLMQRSSTGICSYLCRLLRATLTAWHCRTAECEVNGADGFN